MMQIWGQEVPEFGDGNQASAVENDCQPATAEEDEEVATEDQVSC